MKPEKSSGSNMVCPLGCIFVDGRLSGDCRIPWSEECALKRRDNLKKEKEAWKLANKQQG